MKKRTMTLIGGALLGGIVLATSMPVVAGSKSAAVPADVVETRINQLHGDLRITSAQESQWAPVAQMMRDNGKAMVDLRKQQQVAAAKAPGAVDQLKSYEAVIDAHADSVHKFIPVFRSLYDGMSDAQKKTADGVFRTRILSAKRTA